MKIIVYGFDNIWKDFKSCRNISRWVISRNSCLFVWYREVVDRVSKKFGKYGLYFVLMRVSKKEYIYKIWWKWFRYWFRKFESFLLKESFLVWV